jgi:glycosyltransferase involved in cell wall biosynthesis
VQPILLVLSGLHPSSAGSQALLAARGLRASGHAVHVASWDPQGVLTRKFAAAGVLMHDLGPSRLLQVERLRRLLLVFRAVKPGTTLAWGMPAIRLTAALPRRDVGRWLAAHAIPFDRTYGGRLRDIWALRRAGRVLVTSNAGREEALQFGVPAAEVAYLPPAVDDDAIVMERSPGAHAGRYLLSVGPLERSKGVQDSIWALEILKYLFEDLRLLIVGDGPDADRLKAFASAIKAGKSLEFLGIQPDLSALYAGAAAVWIPAHADRGVQVALEAMQAGRPVVATQRPRLAEIVVDGETGFLVPAGDKVVLAKQTRKLLDDPQLAEQLGQAGRRRAAVHFAPAAFDARLLELMKA